MAQRLLQKCKHTIRQWAIIRRMTLSHQNGSVKTTSVRKQHTAPNAKDEHSTGPPPFTPRVVTDADSYMQSVIPYLPTWAAAICFLLNVGLPGSGTVMSGWFAVCCGIPRHYGPAGTGASSTSPSTTQSQGMAACLCINTFVGVAQFMTITFMLVGWLWSIIWGVMLLLLSRDYTRVKWERQRLARRALELQLLPVGGAQNAQIGKEGKDNNASPYDCLINEMYTSNYNPENVLTSVISEEPRDHHGKVDIMKAIGRTCKVAPAIMMAVVTSNTPELKPPTPEKPKTIATKKDRLMNGNLKVILPPKAKPTTSQNLMMTTPSHRIETPISDIIVTDSDASYAPSREASATYVPVGGVSVYKPAPVRPDTLALVHQEAKKPQAEREIKSAKGDFKSELERLKLQFKADSNSLDISTQPPVRDRMLNYVFKPT